MKTLKRSESVTRLVSTFIRSIHQTVTHNHSLFRVFIPLNTSFTRFRVLNFSFEAEVASDSAILKKLWIIVNNNRRNSDILSKYQDDRMNDRISDEHTPLNRKGH